jgi:hypothetical protein
MNIVRGSKVKWKEGTSYIKGRVTKIYEKATRTLTELDKAFLIRQENGMLVIKNASEIEKA